MPATPTRPQGRNGFSTLRTLFPYLWPPGRPGLKARVVIALFRLAAKAATVTCRCCKHAVDALARRARRGRGASGPDPGLRRARVLSLIFSELRDAIFARVGQHAIRAVGLQIFRHLHGLALRFHLARQTGGLNAPSNAAPGIQTLLSFLLFNILPTFFEIGLVCLVLWRMFDGGWRWPPAPRSRCTSPTRCWSPNGAPSSAAR